MGKLHCPGATNTCAVGKRRAKGPTNTLCSIPDIVGKIIYLILPCLLINSFNNRIHSPVGATGA